MDKQSGLTSIPYGKTLGRVSFVLIVVAFAFYAYRFIERTSFVVDGQRYYALFDDAMISMRYAQNLAAGNGFVWNAGGERVEGYSNPLWVVFMASFHLLGLSASQISRYVQLAAAVILMVNLWVVWNIAKEFSKHWLLPLLTVFLTAFYFPLNNWSLQGMEVSALVLITSGAVLLAVRALKADTFSYWPYVLLGLGTLFRIDMAAPLGVLTLFMMILDRARLRQHLIWGVATGLVFLGSQTLWRLAYYGEWLPNTYYLKVGGATLIGRLTQGLAAFAQFVWTGNWLIMIIPLVLLALRPGRETLLLFAIVGGQMAYSVYVGGDAWEHKGGANRFISISMPLFFILFPLALERIRNALLEIGKQCQRWVEWGSYAVVAGIVFVSIFSLNTLLERDSFQKWATIKRPIFVAGTERYVGMGLTIQRITTADASIAVVTAGNIPYFAERTAIDLLGKSDKVIARTEPQVQAGNFDFDDDFRPGHNKWDYDYSIGELQPDVVAQLWGDTSAAMPYLEADYVQVEIDGIPYWLKRDSGNILWDVVKAEE
ncbi:MAG: hypothetical protein HND51_08030 [Chloroflexi bacterium]|nr:hypothetical protein [Chloroflexota bacterium]